MNKITTSAISNVCRIFCLKVHANMASFDDLQMHHSKGQSMYNVCIKLYLYMHIDSDKINLSAERK